MNYVDLVKHGFRDTVGYMIPGVVGVVWINHGCLRLFGIGADGLWAVRPEWGSFLMLMAVGYVCGRSVSGVVELFCRCKAFRGLMAMGTPGFPGVDRDLLNDCRQEAGKQCGLSSQREQDAFLENIAPKMIFQRHRDLYWWYIDRPSVLRHFVQTFLGMIEFHFLIVFVLLVAPEEIIGGSEKKLESALALLAGLALIIPLFAAMHNAAVRNQWRYQLEVIRLLLFEKDLSPSEESPPVASE